MNVWAWVGIGFGAFLLMSVIIGIAVARILEHIAGEASALLEHKSWLSAPLTRAVHSHEDHEPRSRPAPAPATGHELTQRPR
jgi:hypothetical protein